MTSSTNQKRALAALNEIKRRRSSTILPTQKDIDDVIVEEIEHALDAAEARGLERAATECESRYRTWTSPDAASYRVEAKACAAAIRALEPVK